MQVYHVVRYVTPGSQSSYPRGYEWEAAFDYEEQAREKAACWNSHVNSGVGVSYEVHGPIEETRNWQEALPAIK